MNKFLLAFFVLIFSMTSANAFDLGNVLRDTVSNQRDESVGSKFGKSLIRNMAGGNQAPNTNNQRWGSNRNLPYGAIEKTQEWQEMYKIFEEGTQQMNANYENSGVNFVGCQNNVNMLEYSEDRFALQVNENFPKIHNGAVNLLDVDTFGELDKYNKYSRGKIKVSYLPYTAGLVYAYNRKNDNISKNLSAIAIPPQLAELMDHQYSASGRNYVSDSSNLYAAALYDMTTLGYFIVKNPQFGINFKDYVGSALTLYARDKLLCYFDF